MTRVQKSIAASRSGTTNAFCMIGPNLRNMLVSGLGDEGSIAEIPLSCTKGQPRGCRMESMFDLEGRVAVVTGASRGIGEAMAHALARHGAQVVVSSRRLDGCSAVAAAIEAAGGQAIAKACHIGDMD